MKLICPKCNSKIDQSNINVNQGIGHCQSCSEIIRLADHLHSNEEIRRSEKPFFTKISIDKPAGNFIINIPPKGFDLKASLLSLGVIIFFATVSVFISGENEVLKSITINNFFEKIKTIPLADLLNGSNIFYMLIPFILFPVISSMVLKTQVTINKDQTKIAWSFLGLRYSQRSETRDLNKITEHVMYTQNYEPVYGVALIFKKGRKIKFGSKLTEDERKWIIGEIYEIRDSFHFA